MLHAARRTVFFKSFPQTDEVINHVRWIKKVILTFAI